MNRLDLQERSKCPFCKREIGGLWLSGQMLLLFTTKCLFDQRYIVKVSDDIEGKNVRRCYRLFEIDKQQYWKILDNKIFEADIFYGAADFKYLGREYKYA